MVHEQKLYSFYIMNKLSLEEQLRQTKRQMMLASPTVTSITHRLWREPTTIPNSFKSQVKRPAGLSYVTQRGILTVEAFHGK